MAVTFTPSYTDLVGPYKHIHGTATIASYTASGETVTGSTFGVASIRSIAFDEGRTSNGYIPTFDGTKIHAYQATGDGDRVTAIMPDIKGGVNANHLVDQASAGVNSTYVMAATAGNDATLTGAGVTAGLTAPDYYGRNLNVEISSVGGATATAANVIVTGTFTDGTTTDTIAIPTGAVAAGKFRNRVGTKVALTVTNVQLDAAQPADILVSVGLGTIVGLPNAFAANGDVKTVQKNTAKVGSGTYTASAAKQSVDLGADLADNDEVLVEYETSGSAGFNTEVAAATNVGTMRVTVVGSS